ncbi:MAG: hypothetical protein H3C54_08815 [Taibaiella sp.]|nr:hypothetical protein [Taibaiella sp.]
MNRKQPEILFYVLTGLLIFVYVTIRVFTIPVTIDEAWTLFSFVRHPVWDIVTIKNPSTNNHILNTLLTKLTTIFSEKEFFLRLPNLLSLAGYIWGSYLLAKQLMKNRVLAFAMFLTLLTHFTLLDFFGLCRGYGLSIGLLMLSIAYLVKITKDTTTPRQKHLHIILLTAAAAFYANIAVLHVMVAIFLITSVVLYLRRSSNSILTALRLPIVYAIIIGILGGLKLWKQYESGEIFYGGTGNFVDDTLASMMWDYTGNIYFTGHATWTMNIAVSLMVISIILHFVFIRRQKSYQLIPFAILIFSLVMTNIQFYLLDVPLPINRIALFFFPLMVLTIFTSLQLIVPYSKPIALATAVFLALFGSWRFVSEMNFNKMSLWWMDMYSKQLVEDITKDYRGPGKARVFANWPTDNSVNYYINTYHKDKVAESPCCTRFADLKNIDSFDYIYMHAADDENAFPGMTQIRAYHVDGSLILYRNDSSRRKQ